MDAPVRGSLALVLCVVLVAGCRGSSGDGGQASETVPTASIGSGATPSSGESGATLPDLSEQDWLRLNLVRCDRFGVGSPVDPKAAETYLPEDLDPYVAGGKAVFSLQILSCEDLITDGVSHGPGRFGTSWIRIESGGAAVSLPSEVDLVAQQTDAFYPALLQTDNEAFREATAAFGIPMSLAESMVFDPPAEGIQAGEVIDNEHRPPVAIRWSVDNVDRIPGGSVGRHVLMGRDLAGGHLTYYGEFVHESGWWGNDGTVEIESGSAFEDLIGTRLIASVNGDPVTIDMAVIRDAP